MMNRAPRNRREFLVQSSGVAFGAMTAPYFFAAQKTLAQEAKSASDRPHIGQIGCGGQGNGDTNAALRYGDVLAVCDVDSRRAEQAKGRQGKGKADVYEDYRKVLDRKDIDLVIIGTPDHWHTKIAIEAMQAGKDVYCEKPLTLTIDEGKKIIKVLKETGRVLQVGTQQRSEMELRFLKAVAMVHAGRIGKVQEVHVAIGGAPTSGPLEKMSPPPNLNWEMWLGQAPLVDYIPRRVHYEFRWWYEYSGGKLTDWGAHHVDIAQWAIGMDGSGPTSVDVVQAEHPVPFKDGYPTVDNQYNTATKFRVECKFPNGVLMTINDKLPDPENGILFVGDKGRFIVNRESLRGKTVEELKDNPLPDDALVNLYKGKQPGNHMRNFFECVKSREQPISDVFSHHRALTTCHLANIAIRLNRSIKWDPEKEQIVGDEEANRWQTREQRAGYEINV
jgi:predicted dehydrogenase